MKDLSRFLVQPPAQRRAKISQDSQGHVQPCFEYLQGWKLYRLSGQPIPIIFHAGIFFSPTTSQNFQCSNLCLLFLVIFHTFQNSRSPFSLSVTLGNHRRKDKRKIKLYLTRDFQRDFYFSLQFSMFLT